MRRLIFFTFAVGILMFLLVSTANARTFVSQERITANDGLAQVVATSCEAMVAREDVETFGYTQIADAWATLSSAENRNITQTENAAPGDYLLSGLKYNSTRRSLQTLAEIGRAAPGICSVVVLNWSY